MRLPFWLWVGAAVALDSDALQPQTFGAFTFNRLATPGSNAELTPLSITDNVIQLKKANQRSMSSIILQAMRRARSEGEGGLGRRAIANESTALDSVDGGQVFLAALTVGNQSFDVVIDTGSSDTWLVTDGFDCILDSSGTVVSESECEFGTPYNASASTTYIPIADENFNVTYADEETLAGSMGYDSMTMAGINVPRQKFGLVDYALWTGDGVSSGLVGFAYRTLTMAHPGDDPTKDTFGDAILYNPLFVNMYENEGIPPVFSLAIERDASIAGLLAFGGVPDVPHSPYYVSTPIIAVGVNGTDGALVYVYYSISVDGFACSASPSTQFNPFNDTNPLKTPLTDLQSQVIVDSGTSLIYVPDDAAAEVAAAFTPPASFNEDEQAYYVDCAATPPVFGVSVSNKIFYVNAVDMVVEISDNVCILAVQPNNGGLSILGSAFFRNVVAVFDLGSNQVQFAARQFYDATASPIIAAST